MDDIHVPPAPPDPHSFLRVVVSALTSRAPGQSRPGLVVAVLGVLLALGALALTGKFGFVIAAVTALGLLIGANAYTGRMWPASYVGAAWTLDAVYRSSFGTVMVLKSGPRDAQAYTRMYFQDGLVQNMVGADNRSLSM